MSQTVGEIIAKVAEIVHVSEDEVVGVILIAVCPHGRLRLLSTSTDASTTAETLESAALQIRVNGQS
jgi:hypothetical protein